MTTNSFDLSTYTTGSPVPPSFDPGRYAPPPKDKVESYPLDVEKLKAGVKIPSFLPFWDNSQNVDETPAMRLCYRRMLSDPTVKGAFLTKIFSVMSLNLTVSPPKHLKKDKRSIEIAEFCEWNLKCGMSDGIPGMTWDILSGALIDGFSVSEKVYGAVEQKGRYKGKRRLKCLKAKDVDQDLVVEIDEFRNIIAVRGLRFNAYEPFDPRDFVIYTHLGLFENPTGMSDFRAVYSRYWILDAVWKLRAMACDKRAIPLLVGLWKDPANRGNLERALAAARFQNWISAPADAQITAVNIAGQADHIFADTIKDLREEIVIGIKGSTLTAMTSADHRGDSQVHQDTADLWSWQLQVAILNLLNGHETGLIRDITDRNYTGVDEYPQAMMAGTDDKALKDSLDVLRGLVDLGWQPDKEQVEDRFSWKWQDDPALALIKPQAPGMGPAGPGGMPPSAPPAGPGGQPPPEPMPGATHPAPDGATNPEGDPAADPNQEDLGDPSQRADAMADIMGGAMGSDEALDALEHMGNKGVRKFSEHAELFAEAMRQTGGDAEWSAQLVNKALALTANLELFNEADWRHFPGPRSYDRWQNVKTQKFVYSRDNPGISHRHQPATAQSLFDLPDEKKNDAEPPIAETKSPVSEMVAPTTPEKPAQPETIANNSGTVGNPHLELANILADKLMSGDKIDKATLDELADAAHGGTKAEGKYGPSDAYDSLEAGFNMALLGKTDPTANLADAIGQCERLADHVNALPTQTNRSGNKVAFQQFSTPPHYAYAVAWLANIKPGETVLEPSAGTGCIAVQAANTHADVYANEFDPRRAAFLEASLGADRVSVEDATQLYAIKPDLKPDVVVMNPPFSQTAGRMGDRKQLMEGANHITEALKMMKPGGRLVAIVSGGVNRKDASRGAGMSPDAPYYKEWFGSLATSGYTLKANVGVSGDEYKKYGTNFDTRLLVIDKVDPSADTIAVTGNVETIPDLMKLLEDVRNERSQSAAGAEGASDLPSVLGLSAQSADHVSLADADPPLVPGDDVGDGQATAPTEPAGTEPVGDDLPPSESQADRGADVSGGKPGGARRRGKRKPAGDGVAPVEPTVEGVGGRVGAGGESGSGGGNSKGKLDPVFALRVPELRPSEFVKHLPRSESLAVASKEGSQADLTANVFEPYAPNINVEGMKTHTTPLVESAAMASVQLPPLTYQPKLSPDLVEQKIVTEKRPDGTTFERELGLSAAALENVCYAGQAHQTMLPADDKGISYRQGFMVGDGTGTGKGRQIAGVIVDNENQGRKRHVWLSEKARLISDARRDYADLGGDPRRVFSFEQLRGKNPPADGILFVPYSTLRSGPKDPTAPQNLAIIQQWMGNDFDGVMAFDEAHTMQNSTETKGESGLGGKKPSKQAMAGIDLQRAAPNARVGYWTATAATEPANLLYAERLGLWGPHTDFKSKEEFVNELTTGGTAALEATAQTMKALGVYNARQLATNDGTGRPEGRVENLPLLAGLNDVQKAQYDSAAEGWQHVLKNMDSLIENLSGGEDNRAAKASARSQFWGAQQRFFNQVLMSMAVPAMIGEIQKDLDEGRAPVVQIVNTMAASTERAIKNREADQELDEIDVSPSEILVNYLQSASFPTHRYEKFVDSDGREGMRIVRTAAKAGPDGVKIGNTTYPAGHPIARELVEVALKAGATLEGGEAVEDPDAIRKRDELVLYARDLRIPEAPLDQLTRHFGPQFAEVTGRKQRFVWEPDENGEMKKVQQTRGNGANDVDMRAFQNGDKRILAFSGAGNTGASYHADKRVKNQGRRVHYVLQAGWSATPLVQSLGRTHRTNQSSAPIVRPIGIPEAPANKRFVSSATRRLESMGALTRGQKAAAGGGVFGSTDNLETPEAEQGLERFMKAIRHGQIDDLPYRETMAEMGFETERTDPKTGTTVPKDVETTMKQFLNRLLCVKLGKQGTIFDHFERFHQQAIEQAEKQGTLQKGVENFPAQSITFDKAEPVWKDPRTGAEARLVTVKTTKKNVIRQWDANEKGELPVKFVTSKQFGKPWAVYKGPNTTDVETGHVVPHYVLRGSADQRKLVPVADLDNKYTSSYEAIERDTAKSEWEKEVATIGPTKESVEHFVKGAILPIWKKIPSRGLPRIYRIKPNGGRAFVGRHVPAADVDAFKKKMGLNVEAKTHAPADVHRKLEMGQATARLENGWKLKPSRVANQTRIEIVGPSLHDRLPEGAFREIIQGRPRFFVPTGERGPAVLAAIAERHKITDVNTVE